MEQNIQIYIKNIDDLTKKIKKIEIKLEEAKKNELKKNQQKFELEQELYELEEKKNKKLAKLEKLKTFVNNYKNKNYDEEVEFEENDFNFKPQDAYKFIPNSALEGLQEIQKSIEELKNIFSDEKPESEKVKNIFLSYY